MLQYPDDTEIFVTNDNSIREVFEIIKQYGLATGAKANVEKTKVLWSRKWKNREDHSFGSLTNSHGIVGCVGHVGLWVYYVGL